jgi:hypothetical protein
MKGTHEQNEHKKKTLKQILLPTKRAKINWASISPEVKIKVKLFLCFN